MESRGIRIEINKSKAGILMAGHVIGKKRVRGG